MNMNEIQQQLNLGGDRLYTLEDAEHIFKERFKAELAKEGVARDWLTDKDVRVYKRSMHVGMARWLLALYKKADYGRQRGYFEIRDLPTQLGGDYGKLKHWGLVSFPGSDKRPDGSNRTGYVKITQRGVEFVEGKINMPGQAMLLNNRLLGFAGNNVYIHQVIENFNYSDILPGRDRKHA